MVSMQPETTTEKPADEVRVESTETVGSSDATVFADQSDHDNLLAFQQDRDASAFAVLVERHQGMVFGIAQRMLGCSHAAEDVVQATFLVLANSANKIRKRHSLVSWLYGVAYRVSARTLRQRAKITVSTLRDEVMVSADPLETLNAQYEQNSVFEELHRLREELKTPMVLRYLNGKSNSQVAEEMNLSESAVEGRLKRARKQLRVRLARKGVTFSVAIGLLAIVQRESAAACVSTSAAKITSASLSCQTISEFAKNAGSGIETGFSNEAINMAEQEIFKMASIKVATFAVIASVALGIAASGWALAGDTYASNQGKQQSSDVFLETTESGANPGDVSTTLTLQSEDRTTTNQDTAEIPIFVGDSKPVKLTNEEAAIRTRALGYYSSDELSVGELAIHEALRKPAKFDYFETRLGDIFDELMTNYQMQILVDEKALSQAGTSSEVLATFKVTNVSLNSALTAMLEKHGLAAIITNEVLFITTVDQAESIQTTRVYSLPDHWPMNPATFRETILATIDKDVWEDLGGASSATTIEEGIVITATHKTHSNINGLLKQLDRLYPK